MGNTNETFEKILKLQRGGSFKYTSAALPIGEFERLQVDPSQYVLGQQQAGTSTAETKEAGVDYSALELDGETSEVNNYVNRIKSIENKLAEKTRIHGSDFLGSQEALSLQNQLTHALTVGPVELKRNLELRKENDDWLDKNIANMNWATDSTGDNYLIVKEDGTIGKASAEELAKNPELARRRLRNKDVQDNIKGPNTADFFMFNPSNKNVVKNSIGFDPAFKNLMDLYDAITGSEERGGTKFTPMSNKTAMQGLVADLEESPLLMTTNIKSDTNQANIQAVVKDILAGRGLDTASINAIKQQAVDNILRMNHDWNKPLVIKDKEGNDVSVTFNDAVNGEMQRILVMGKAMKLNISNVTSQTIKGIPDGKSGSGSEDGYFGEAEIAVNFMGGTPVEDKDGLNVTMRSLFTGGGLDKSGEKAIIIDSKSANLINTSKASMPNSENTNVDGEVALSVATNGWVTGDVYVKPVVVQGRGENATILNNLFEEGDKDQEIEYLSAQRRFMENIAKGKQMLLNGEINEEGLDEQQANALADFKRAISELELKEGLDLNDLYIDYAIEYNDVIAGDGEGWLWNTLWTDKTREAVAGFGEATPEQKAAYQKRTGLDIDNLVVIPKITYLMNESSLSSVRLVDFKKIKRSLAKDLFQQPIASGRGQKYNAEDVNNPTASRYQKGGRIRIIRYKDIL